MLDLAYPGPHAVLLPYDHDRLFIDYAWIIRRLYDFFVGVSIPDQNFKGDALERIVRFKRSVLPIGPCKVGNEERQIDAAFEIEKRLIIVECKAVGRSIGFDRGQPQAIRYRKQIIDRALDEVDRKAQWLSSHPQGSNYDIRQYHDILPIAVTPFVEYIPSLSSHYWLTETLPRVLTPRELKESLTNGVFLTASRNIVSISLPQ